MWPETRVLQLPEMASIPPMPALFVRYLDHLGPGLALSPPVLEILENIEHPELRLAKTKQAFEYYPDEARRFVNYVRITRKLEEIEGKTLDQTLPLYGLDAARNMAVCFAIYKEVVRKHSFIEEHSGRPTFDPPKLLSYANKCLERFGEGSRYPHRIYTAGIVFDVLRVYSDFHVKTRKQGVQEFIDQAFHKGEQAARLVSAFSKKMKKLRMLEYAVPAALLHEAGKAILATLEPSSLDFFNAADREQLPRTVSLQAEAMRFGVSHAGFGYLACQALSGLKPAALALRHYHEPFVLKQSPEQKDLGDLAATLCLAANVVSTGMKLPSESKKTGSESAKAPADASALERALAEEAGNVWVRPEMDGHELTPEQIFSVVKEVRG